jgi:hypothetical protein
MKKKYRRCRTLITLKDGIIRQRLSLAVFLYFFTGGQTRFEVVAPLASLVTSLQLRN